MSFSGLSFSKGHGTQNDFVLIADDHAARALVPAEVVTLADRRQGLGADGIIRVVATANAGIPEAVAQADTASWFMDYYNADGSTAEMCGNGVRVFAHYLVQTGRVAPDTPVIPVATRDGVKYVRRVPNPYPDTASQPWYSIDMGRWHLPGDTSRGADALVDIPGIEVARPGLSVDMGNPHTVVALAEAEELASANLAEAPLIDPAPDHGSNVELIVMEPEQSMPGQSALTMRVHERGVGETRSCGTGACAAAIAASYWGGAESPAIWRVDVPGGTLQIGINPEPGHTSGTVSLAGPATLVASGTLA